MRILKVTQLKHIQLENSSFIFPFDRRTRIILDKKARAEKKIHQLVFQQGPQYGSVGDNCEYLTNEQLFALEEKGMIKIKKSK